MIFRQMLNDSLSAASYVIGCVATGAAAVVDPGLPAEQYALFAADKGLRIRYSIETHLHADYFSTGRALAALTGAEIVLPASAEALFPHLPLSDGETLAVGNIRISALHTPGHTPEHTAYLVSDLPRGAAPWFVLTGDCLFVGDVGRADLLDLPQTGPHVLYDSIVQKLLSLPDHVEIFPAHYGGSACGGKAMSGKLSSTIGFERRFNWALQAPDRATFCAWVRDTPRTAVESVVLHRHTNQGRLPLPAGYGAPVPSAALKAAPPALDMAAAEAALGDALLIDVRPRDAFLAGHRRGALHAPYSRDALVGRVAQLVAPGVPLVVLAETPLIGAAAAALLASDGRNPLRGYVDADLAAWNAADPAEALPALRIDQLHERVRAGAQVLDVREPFEWAKGVIPGALLVRAGALREALATFHNGPLYLICESGTRATMMASLLRQAGFSAVAVVAPEGMSDYAAQYPVVKIS